MIAFFLGNRLFAEAAGALLLIVAMWTYVAHHDAALVAIGEHSCEAKLAQSERAAAATALAIATRYQLTQVQPAEIQHAQDIAAIPVRVVTTPLWLRHGQVCAGPVPALPETAGSDPGSGGVVDGPGRDIRPAIEAVKLKYETALADCRRLDREWPP